MAKVGAKRIGAIKGTRKKREKVQGLERREVKAAEETARRKAGFLKAFQSDPVVSYACHTAKVDRRTHYKWMEDDEEYARAFNEIVDRVTDELEKEAKRRAVDGVIKPQFFKGQIIKDSKNLREYSDTLLIFLLKARRPHVYRERMELMGPGGTPLNPNGSGSPTKLLVEFIKGGNADKQDPDPRKV